MFKFDRIGPMNYGIIHLYLNRVGGTEATIESAIRRLSQNLNSCKLVDISLAMANAAKIDDKN